MPRYEYRLLKPTPAAEKAFLTLVDQLDREFTDRDPERRSDIVRDVLSQLYLEKPYAVPDPTVRLAQQTLLHCFDPRNTATG